MVATRTKASDQSAYIILAEAQDGTIDPLQEGLLFYENKPKYV